MHECGDGLCHQEPTASGMPSGRSSTEMRTSCLAGGTEGAICPIGVAGFTNLTALSTSPDPLRASIPFDKDRSGFVLGEGAGIVVLEELSHAKKRGAKILAELVGYGATSDAYHITSPLEDGSGAAKGDERWLWRRLE